MKIIYKKNSRYVVLSFLLILLTQDSELFLVRRKPIEVYDIGLF
jgi:hypothetical protein